MEGALEQQRRFMADASHEMRTPTATLRAEAEVTLARAHRTESEYRESVQVMLQAGQRLGRLVDDLFLLARVDAGHLALRVEPVYLEEIVHDAVRAVVQVGERRGVTVELRQMTQAPFRGDHLLLDRLLLNLLDNAIKHTPAGGAVVLELRASADGPTLVVRDTGSGIPEELLGRIFERFYRVERDRSRERGGSGLGLAIVKHLCQALQVTLTVRSKLGEGSEFTARFPRV